MVRIRFTEPQEGYLDVKEGTSFPINISIADIRDVTTKSGTYSKTIVLDGTDNNNTILGYLFDVNTTTQTFDVNAIQKCDVIQDGVTIMQDAYFQLSAVNNLNGALEYNATVFESKVTLFDRLGQQELTDLDFTDFNHDLTTTNMVASFSNFQSGYKYLLPYTDRTFFVISEVKPAIYTREYLDRMFARARFSYSIPHVPTRERIFNTLIPYNGDQFKATQEVLDAATSIATESSFIKDEVAVNGRLNYNSVDDFIAGTEVSDPSSLYDNTTGEYEAPYYTPPDNGGYQIEVSFTYALKFINSSGSTAYLVNDSTGGNLRNIFTAYIKKNGTTQVYRNDIFNNVLLGGNNIPNGTTTRVSGTTSFTSFATSINENDLLNLAFGYQSTHANTTWRATSAKSGATVNIETEWEITNLTIKFVPKIDTVGFGFPIQGNDLVPKKIKQSDFLKSILTMFNMLAIVDPTDDRNIILETRDRFYDNGTRKDWTSKIDLSKEKTLTFLPELTNKRMVFTYKQDNDPANTTFKQATNEVYGQLEFVFDNEYIKDTTTKEIIFSPTPISSTSIGAYLPLWNGYDPKNNIRILNDCGNANCNTYSIYDYGTTGVTRSTYPLVHHFDNALTPDFDLNFGTCDYYFYQPTVLTNNTLFNLYYRRTLNQINKGKMLTAYFKLNELDIYNLKLSDTIQIDNALYNINKVIDYDANGNETTKVELITVDDGFSTFKKNKNNNDSTPNTTLLSASTGTKGIIIDVQRSANIVTSDSAIVVGRGNVVDGNNVMVVGDNNTVVADNTTVQGNDNVVSGEGVQVVGDENDTNTAVSTSEIKQMKIGLSQTGTSNPTITEFFNTTGETLSFIRFSEGYYYAILPASMYDLFIENLYTSDPFATSGSTNISINGRVVSYFLELDSGDRLISIRCFQSDGTTPEELVDVITADGILFLPTIYVK
jgi:hypothetical protein